MPKLFILHQIRNTLYPTEWLPASPFPIHSPQQQVFQAYGNRYELEAEVA